ncbi:MAG: ROK family protein [candidate division WOR-3 bacterium]
MKKDMIIGIDIGGTFIKIGFFKDGEIIKRIKIETPKNGKEILDKIIEIILNLKEKIDGIGIGLPGMIYKGKLVQAPNLKGLEGFEVEKYLKERISFEFYIDNDANCAALGEKYFGLAKDLNDFIVITLGTGVGGGIFSNGKLLRGKDGLAGEIGHITIFPDGIRCNCGKIGCLEVYASKEGFKKILRENVEPEEIARRAKEGIEKYKKVFDLMGFSLGIACGNLVNIFNPEAIIFTGGISKSYDLFKESFLNSLKENAFSHLLKNLKIKVSSISEDSGVLGAIGLFIYEKRGKSLQSFL